jgi:hypothetical protein
VDEKEDAFEQREIPVELLSAEIVYQYLRLNSKYQIRRTESVAGREKNCVSSKPIILRTFSYHC